MKNFKKLSIKKSLIALAAVAVIGAVAYSANSADAAFTASSVNFPAKHTDGSVKNLNAQGVAENLSGNGTYTVTYRITSNGQEVNFPLKTAIHKCPQGNGHARADGAFPVCEQEGVSYNDVNVNLNAGNNYTQDVSFSTTQDHNLPCGSFQSDIFSNTPTPNANGFFYASLKLTGKDLASCMPVSSPSPSPSMSPSPSPSASPSTIQCPVGKISKVVDSTIICVSQNQTQNQTQTQNNNQNQTVNQNVVATGGNSSSSSSSSATNNVTINNNPTSTTTTIKEIVKEVPVSVTPQVVMQTKGAVAELPKTGLPLAALALGGLLPAGFGIKRFGKKSEEVSANSIWTEKQLNS